MSGIKIHHYKRASATSRNKELIAELVTADSETGRFLDRLERIRTNKPCYLTIDMRGKVPGECSRHIFNNREFYLDQVSYGIFQHGLQEHNGVFTVGIYEAVVNGEHTNRAIRDRELRGDKVEQAPPIAPKETKDIKEKTEEVPDNPPTTIFGYYQKRTEPRLNYATDVELICGAATYRAKTRDVSVGGIGISLKDQVQLSPNQRVIVSFSKLYEEHEEQFLLNIPYELVKQKSMPAECRLMLKLGEQQDEHPIRAFLNEFVEKYRLRYKFEIEDLLTETTARMYERGYSENLSGLPFYIAQTDEGSSYVSEIAVTDGNSPLAQFFSNDVEQLDLSPLCLPHRLDQMLKDKEALFVLYRAKGGSQTIRSATAQEYSAPDKLSRFINHAFQQPEYCVVKALLKPVNRTEKQLELLQSYSQRIEEENPEEADQFRQRVQQICMVGMLYDVTDEVNQLSHRDPDSDSTDLASQLSDLHYWEHSNRHDLFNDEITQQPDQRSHLAPNTTVFGYRERRRESRYLANTEVSVTFKSRVYPGNSVDISTRGLCIRLDDDSDDVDLSRGDEVRVHLVSLQKKRPTLNLKAVPYQVVSIVRTPEVVLGLERLSEKNYHEITGFFNEVIDKNKHKLKLDLSEAISVSSALIYAQMLCETNVSIPFFIGKDDDEPPVIQAVATTEPLSDLADFVLNDKGESDFRFLARRRVVSSLYLSVSEMKREALRENKRPSPCELEIYLWKSTETGNAVQSACTADFDSDTEREKFINELFAKEQFRVVKLIATYTTKINEGDIDCITEIIRSSSRYRASQLDATIRQVIGLGELIDITHEFTRLAQTASDD